MRLNWKTCIFITLCSFWALADTPPPGAVFIKGGTDTTKIGNVSDALKVSISSFPGSISVTQGTSPWVISGNTGRTWTLLNSSDSITSFQGGSWSVGVNNFPSTFGVTQSTTPWVISGNVNATQSGAWTVQQGSAPWSVSQSGTWNVGLNAGSNNIGSLTNITGTISLPTGAASATNQTSGSQKTQIVDGSGNVIGPAQTISGTNYEPVVLAASAIPGSGVVGRSIQIAGSDGTNAQTISVDTSGQVNVNAKGHASLSTFTQSYSSSNLSISAFTTIISSTSAAINMEDIFDNSGGVWYLAYAATCGALSTSSNAVIIGPGGGGKDFLIPSGQCVGFQAIGTAITSGNVYMTFYK